MILCTRLPVCRAILFAACCGLAACVPQRSVQQATTLPQTSALLVIGEFEDDYGIQFQISHQEWFQLPDARYRIVSWRSDDQYLIAQNDSSNPSDPGLWTRIDWMTLSDMPPFEWAFCMSAYDAPTAADAERASHAIRDTPKSGCNGFPFSRMKRTGTDNP
jgi:hypothetical protein